MSEKLKIQQHIDLHADRESGKLYSEDDQYWNYFTYKNMTEEDMSEHNDYDAFRSS